MPIPSAFSAVLVCLVLYLIHSVLRAIKLARAIPDMTGYGSKTETDTLVKMAVAFVAVVFYLLGAWFS